ncbi:MAG: PAS domain S-box protein, partial [candidate division Zixibacteria bacterium]|nr:PAS domain S-box protein [candidate division Zixibacteria bacterium]
MYREGGFLEGSVIDITERLENERALRESEELFRAVADTAPVVIVINQGEKLIYANRAALTAIGMDASELGKVNFSDFIHPSHRQMVTNIALARQRGEAVPTTY